MHSTAKEKFFVDTRRREHLIAMRFMSSILLLAAVFGAPLVAEDKVYRNKKLRITFTHPADWSITENEETIVVESPDKAASFTVRVETTTGRTPACEELKLRSEEWQRQNLLPDDKRVVSEDQLRFMGVKDGCLGAYQLTEGNTEILSGVGLYINGKRLWLVEQRLLAARHRDHAAAISAVAMSFTTK